MTQQAVTSTQKDHILLIGINRPQKKNALSLAMYQSLTEAITQAQGDDAIRVIFLHGTETCFCSGNDVQDFKDGLINTESSPALQFIHALAENDKPLIAVVQGPAIGIGTTMLLHCDLVYAAEDASFQLPFVNLGLCPEAGSSLLLPQLLGHQRAAELLLLGETFNAQRACELGLVNAVYNTNYCHANALRQAQSLAAKPPAAVRLTKTLLKQANRALLKQTIGEEIGHLIQRLQSPEAAEAFAAFLEHRPADFSAFH